jgi:signal transduction histidine kinase
VRLINELRDNFKLAMIGLFYGEDIHHTSNKLSAARMHASFIRRYPDKSVKVVKKARRIETNIQEILSLRESIQETFTNISLSRINLYYLLQNAVAENIDENIISVDWSLNCGITRGAIQAPTKQVDQVFRAIMYNTKEALRSNKQGEIRIALQDIKQSGQYFVEVAITDNGPGIPEDLKSYVFEISDPRPGRKRTGTGFGLAWARLFLRWFGGDLFFISPVSNGRGTTMIAVFPRLFSHMEI